MNEYKYESMILQDFTKEDIPSLVKMYESWVELNTLSQKYGRAVLVPDVLSGGLLSLAYGLPRVAKGARFQAYHVDEEEGYFVKTCGTSYDLMPYHYDENRAKVLFIDFFGQENSSEFKGDFWVYQISADEIDDAAAALKERNSQRNARGGSGGHERRLRISIKRDIIRRKGMEGEHFSVYSLSQDNAQETPQESQEPQESVVESAV